MNCSKCLVALTVSQKRINLLPLFGRHPNFVKSPNLCELFPHEQDTEIRIGHDFGL
jgi:hypothetical protein